MATAPKRTPRLMTVTDKRWLTPNMIRVTLTAPWMAELESGIEGAHCKIFLPRLDQSNAQFAAQLEDGPRPDVRTYTIRFMRPQTAEMDIDFVDHGDAGPASAWARRCEAGDVCGFAGPGPVKLTSYHADYYVVAADMSALPVAAATLEAMPQDAKGIAFLEVTDEADRQDISIPQGVEVHWLVHPDTHVAPTRSVERIAALPDFEGTVQTCIAGESSMIKSLREEILKRRGIPKGNAYISGYWKVGMIEPQHQQYKNSQPA